MIGTVVIAGVLGAGTLGAGIKTYREEKRLLASRPAGKKEFPWTVAAERFRRTIKLTNKKKKSPQRPVARWAKLQERVSGSLVGNLIAPYIDQTRRYQLSEIASSRDAFEISEAEKKAKFEFFLASGGVLLALSGSLFYAPLYVPSLLLMGYLFKDEAKEAYQALVCERRIGIEVLLAIELPAAILSGFIVTGTFGIWSYKFMQFFLAKTENHSRNSLVNLFGQQPRFVWVLVDSADGKMEQEIEIPFEDLKSGSLVVVMAGQTIPVDGTIERGIASIDQRMLTGEAQPCHAGASDSVFAGTMVLSGKIIVRVQQAGEQTVLAQIGQILNHTDDFDQSIRSRVLTLQDKAVPALFALAGLGLPWVGASGALAVLWYAPGTRMIIFGPMSMVNFLHICSQKRILIKDGRSLELLSDIDTVVFDKTGTLTIEQPTVSRITSLGALSKEQLLYHAAVAEYKQTHPVAKAILTAAAERGLELPTIDDAHCEIGYGVKVRLHADDEAPKTIRVGSERFMTLEGIAIPASVSTQQAACHAHGYGLVMVAIDEQLSGTIELRPTIRPEAKEVVRRLQAAGKTVSIISGDHEMPTRQLAEELGISEYFANTLPENKAELVAQLQQEGKKVCFVGDGINDAIALKKADVSISLRGATTVATDSAQIVLMDENLTPLTEVFEIAQEFKTNIDRSFLAAIVPNMLGIAGTLFLNWGYATAVLLGSAFWLPQLALVMRPLYKHKADNRLPQRTH